MTRTRAGESKDVRVIESSNNKKLLSEFIEKFSSSYQKEFEFGSRYKFELHRVCCNFLQYTGFIIQPSGSKHVITRNFSRNFMPLVIVL